VKQFVAVDLLTFTTEISGRDGQLSQAVFSSATRSSKPSSGLNRNDDLNMACEAYRADAPVKHIIGQDCQDMRKFSVASISSRVAMVVASSFSFAAWGICADYSIYSSGERGY
jgi:hypothetical protein